MEDTILIVGLLLLGGLIIYGASQSGQDDSQAAQTPEDSTGDLLDALFSGQIGLNSLQHALAPVGTGVSEMAE